MKILIITPYFYPEKTGISIIATMYAEFCSELGHEVEVITAFPHFPEWTIKNSNNKKHFYTEYMKKIKINRVWLYIPSKISPFRRIVYELSFSLFVFMRALFIKGKLVICVIPFLSTTAMIAVLAAVKRQRLWSFIMDHQLEAAIEYGMIRNPLLILTGRFLERLVIKFSEKILTISRGMIAYLKLRNVNKNKLFLLPMSLDVPNFREVAKNPPPQNYFNQWINVDHKFIVLYSGALSVKYDFQLLIDCAKYLNNRSDIFFAIVGEGPGEIKDFIRSQISENKLKNIGLFPLSPEEELPHMLKSADIAILPFKKNLNNLVFPLKLLLYLAGGKPIIIVADSENEISKLVEDNRIGKFVKNDDINKTIRVIEEFKNNPELQSECAERAFEYAMNNFYHKAVFESYFKPLLEN